MTKSPILFLSYLTIFIGISLYLTLATKIDIVNTYSALIEMQNDTPYIAFDGKLLVESEKVYTYIDKNIEVYEIYIQSQSASYDTEKSLYEVKDNNLIRDFFIKNNGKEIKVDIPKGQITLFRRIFFNGGKA
jgi:hypothetical protein